MTTTQKNTSRAPTQDPPIQNVHEVLDRHLPDFDKEAVTTTLACYLANDLHPAADPVWIILIAPPSYGKTTVLEAFEGVEEGVELVGDLTPRTLLSGYSEEDDSRDRSLLTSLGRRPKIVIKELGTILEGRYREMSKILAQLREVYDGSISKHFGNDEHRRWDGKATIVAGMTGAIDQKRAFRSQLGERFLRLRFKSHEDPVKRALAAGRQLGESSSCRSDLTDAYRRALVHGREEADDLELSDDTHAKIARIASLVARMRADVDRDRYNGHTVTTPPEVEGTPRLQKQLIQIARAYAALRRETDLTDLGPAYRLALDAMPEPRRSIFLEAMRGINERGYATVIKDGREVLSKKQAREKMNDLDLVGVLDKSKGTTDSKGRPPYHYTLDETAQEWMDESELREWLEEEYLT